MNKQTTILNPVEISGKGIHNGEFSKLKLLPTVANTGIMLNYQGLNIKIEPNKIQTGVHTTSLKIGNNYVHTIEHLMAAIHGLGIDNCQIVLIGSPEIPFLDGSALPWLNLFDKAKIVTLPVTRKDNFNCLPFEFISGISHYKYTPNNELIIDCEIDFPKSFIGNQRFTYFHKKNGFNEIAKCRTFLMDTAIGEKFDINRVMQRLPGLDINDLSKNIIICDKNQFITSLRTELEPVKHKILDFMGDMRCIGFPLKGKFKIYKPSHAANVHFIQELYHRNLTSELSRVS